jgi:hypothetical protein
MRYRYLLTTVILMAVAARNSPASVDLFAPTLVVGTNTLRRVGVGELRRWLIKGCDVALYAPPGVRKGGILEAAPRCLELRYVHPIRAEQFVAAAVDTLARNHTPTELEAVKREIETLHALYRDVGKQDRYRLLYMPGKGTSLFLNGKLLGTVPGARFAAIYFGVWLGDNPLDKKLKQQLLADLP